MEGWNHEIYFRHLSIAKPTPRWPRGLRHGSADARLLGLRVRIPPGARMSVSCECCVLSGRGLCNEPITRPEDSYRLWCAERDLETSTIRRPGPSGGCRAVKKSDSFSRGWRKMHFLRRPPKYARKSSVLQVTFRPASRGSKCHTRRQLRAPEL